MPTVVLRSLLDGVPAAAHATLPGHARLVIQMCDTGGFGYWYARLAGDPWKIPLPDDTDLAVVPPGWRSTDTDGRQVLVARELIIATSADTPELEPGVRGVNLGVAVVIDPTLIQDDRLDSAKVLYLGGFGADVEDN